MKVIEIDYQTEKVLKLIANEAPLTLIERMEISLLVEVLRNTPEDCGVSSATALSLQLHILGIDHGMVYVRKDNEDSHGEPIEKEPFADSAPLTFIFVDDFVSSGATKKDCIRKISDCVWWPEGKEDFDYCAVQEYFNGEYGCHMKAERLTVDGRTLCKN